MYSFKDLMVLPVESGEDEYLKYRAMKRRKHMFESAEEVDEALTATQRRARGRQFKKYKAKIKLGQERAKRKIASPEKLKKRSRKAARNAIISKITKGMSKADLTFARRQEIEKRLETPAMKKKIDNLAKKMLTKVRKAELEKKRGAAQK